ncbi:MAG: hypothetical protein D6690_17320 [Nitrospirae bacterium]|nr:MAG: hypothetical protein D6690_17320 [Nitrospirota bacterium]
MRIAGGSSGEAGRKDAESISADGSSRPLMKLWIVTLLWGIRCLLAVGIVCGIGGSGFAGEVHSADADQRTSVCETAKECFIQALQLVEQVRWGSASQEEEALARLQAIQSRFPESVWARRAEVHLGLLRRQADPDRALRHFARAQEHFPLLEDYIRLWIGEAYLQLSDHHKAAEAFEALIHRVPETVLAAEAMFRAGKARIQSGSCARGYSLLQQALEKDPTADWAPQALLAIGTCGLQLNRLSLARDALRTLWAHYPVTPEAETAASLLDEEDWMAPTPTDSFQRASSLQRAARLEEAVSAWHQYLALGRDRIEKWDRAQFQLGLAYTGLRRYDRAQEVFHRLASSGSRLAGQATVWLGRVYLRQGDGEKLTTLCHASDHKRLSGNQRALLWVFCGVWFQDHNQEQKALEAYRRASEEATASPRRLDALWRAGWLHYRQGRYDQAIAVFQTILVSTERTQQGQDDRLRAWYWIGRAKEQIHAEEEAHRLYRTLAEAYPYTYYGQLARSRLHARGIALTSNAFTRFTERAEKVETPPRLTEDIHYRKAVQLAELRLFSEAVRELDALERRYGREKPAASALIALAQQVRAYHVGIRLAIRHFSSDLQQGRLHFSSPVWVAAYPRGYLPVVQASIRNLVDPYLISGIIREESLYDRQAVSRVGAMGLMQLMPSTAQKVAQGLGIPRLVDDSLFSPQLNIYLGATYLAQLLERFGGNVVYAVAAYNAGPHVVQKWMKRHGEQSADEFIESIAYRETRGYVKRVLGSYRIYHALNGESCRMVSLDRLC